MKVLLILNHAYRTMFQKKWLFRVRCSHGMTVIPESEFIKKPGTSWCDLYKFSFNRSMWLVLAESFKNGFLTTTSGGTISNIVSRCPLSTFKLQNLFVFLLKPWSILWLFRPETNTWWKNEAEDSCYHGGIGHGNHWGKRRGSSDWHSRLERQIQTASEYWAFLTIGIHRHHANSLVEKGENLAGALLLFKHFYKNTPKRSRGW